MITTGEAKVVNFYPCVHCGRGDVKLIYYPGSENLLCEACSKKFYPTQQSVEFDRQTHLKALEAGIL